MNGYYQSLESLSFGKAIRSSKNPVTSLLPSRSQNKSGCFKHQNDYQLELVDFFDSKTKLIKRTNMTLRKLLDEFEQLSTNQYILRLKYPLKCQGGKKFDQWIMSVEDHSKDKIESLQTTFGCPIFNLIDNKIKITEQKEQKYKDAQQERKQINSQSISLMKQMRETNCSLTAIEQTNCSLTAIENEKKDFFDGSSTIQVLFQQKIQMTTKISIIDQGFQEDQVIQTETSQTDYNLEKQLHKAKQSNEQCDKENQDPNLIIEPPEIKGLEFSKNKRFKNSKRRQPTKG